jgi:hypothetical protein
MGSGTPGTTESVATDGAVFEAGTEVDGPTARARGGRNSDHWRLWNGGRRSEKLRMEGNDEENEI